MKLRGLFKTFDQASALFQPITPGSLWAERSRNEAAQRELERTKAAQRQQREQRLASAVQIAPEDMTLQVNAAVGISLKDRIAVYGMTGTGKTTWVRELLPRLKALVPQVGINIIDSKGQNEYNDMATRLYVGPDAPPPARPGEILVWVIPGRVDKVQLDEFLHNVLAAGGPSITVADEIANYSQGDGFIEGLDLMLKQGRFSAKMFIGMSQEYAGNTRNLFGQTTHVLRFHLLDTYDAREVNKKLGLPTPPRQQPKEPPLPYGFFYRRVDRPSPVIQYSGWQEFFRF